MEVIKHLQRLFICVLIWIVFYLLYWYLSVDIHFSHGKIDINIHKKPDTSGAEPISQMNTPTLRVAHGFHAETNKYKVPSGGSHNSEKVSHMLRYITPNLNNVTLKNSEKKLNTHANSDIHFEDDNNAKISTGGYDINANDDTADIKTGDEMDIQHNSYNGNYISNVDDINQSGSTLQNNPHMDKSGMKDRKIVLFWNQFFSKGWGSILGSNTLIEYGCPVTQCLFTDDRSLLERADAIVIHGFSFSHTELPLTRTVGQIYVFLLFENPLLTGRSGKLQNSDDIFNLTFTYLHHRDTDIAASHGSAIRRSFTAPGAVPRFDFVNTKNKLVLWIVSNCNPYSARTEYATKLGKYITVDVVGRCGNISCPLPKDSHTCIKKLSEQYMFYLAFENSHCQDYFTEKVVHPLRYNMVPITMGRTDYSKHLPPGSYIDVDDYSPKQLADKLEHLKKYPDEYMKYFQWKKDYEMQQDDRKMGYCKLCEILHKPNYPYKSNFSVAEYWNPNKLCLNKTEHLAKLGLD